MANYLEIVTNERMAPSSTIAFYVNPSALNLLAKVYNKADGYEVLKAHGNFYEGSDVRFWRDNYPGNSAFLPEANCIFATSLVYQEFYGTPDALGLLMTSLLVIQERTGMDSHDFIFQVNVSEYPTPKQQLIHEFSVVIEDGKRFVRHSTGYWIDDYDGNAEEFFVSGDRILGSMRSRVDALLSELTPRQLRKVVRL